MATTTYNNGLYTPDTTEWWQTTSDVTSYNPYGTTVTQASTVWYTPATTTSSSRTRTTSTTATGTTSVSFASQASWSAPVTTSYPTTTSTNSATATVATSSFATSRLTSLSRPALASSSASASHSSASSFKILYLLPVFIIVPLLILLSILGWTYGRWWGKRGRGGGGASSYRDSWAKGILSPEQEEGLVEGKWVGDQYDGSGGGGYYDEKQYYNQAPAPTSRWDRLKRMVSSSTKSSTSRVSEGPAQSFRAVPYEPMEAPFTAPQRGPSISRKHAFGGGGSEFAQGERGWGWGASSSAQRPDFLSSEWGTKRYRAKSANSSRSSRRHGAQLGRSDTLASRISARLFGVGEVSPSIYSPTVEQGGHQGKYIGLGGGGYDDEDEEEEEQDPEKRRDAMLADSRVADGDLARRYIAGTATAKDFRMLQPSMTDSPPIRAAATRPYRNDGWRGNPNPVEVMQLPKAPTPLHPSPTKKSSTIVRSNGSITTTPTRGNPLLFSYDSPDTPDRTSNTYTALPERRPFPREAARIPSVPFIPPPRTNSSTPLDPNLLFTKSSSSRVGGPMPAYEPGALRASESAFSLSGGVQDLVYGADNFKSSRNGLKDIARNPTSRKEQTEQLRQSAPDVRQGVQAPAPVNDIPSQRQKLKGPRPRTSSQQGFTLPPGSFADPAPIPRLNHPSRVRAAVEELESRSTSPTTSPARTTPAGRLPIPPSSTRLSRSTTIKPQPDEDVDDHSNAIGKLLLQRSRTSVYVAGGPISSDGGHSSVPGYHQTDEDTTDTEAPARRRGPRAPDTSAGPLTSDPKRLSALLRREPTVKATGNDSPSRSIFGVTGGAMGGSLEAMLRRSMPASSS
ncbi:hypothetical protein T439DRAFT_382729 [Meredithblackwellia eburnea MCA 4105]